MRPVGAVYLYYLSIFQTVTPLTSQSKDERFQRSKYLKQPFCLQTFQVWTSRDYTNAELIVTL